MDRFGAVLALFVGLANLGWLLLENGGQPPLHSVATPITIGLITLAALAFGIELYRVARRRSSGLGLALAAFGVLFALLVGALVCCLHLPASPV